jgi:glycosyltransferase involved in cell wall biosynthesis
MKIGIVIPAYNEEKRIGRTLKVYGDFFKKNLKIQHKILVAINNTKDRTLEIVKKEKLRNKNIDYINLKKGGKGYAITEGFRYLLKKRYDYIGFVDADIATPPEAYFDLINNLDNYDGIIASRYIKGAIVEPRQPLQRIIISRFGNFIIRTLFFLPYHDTQCGAKLFRSFAIEKVLDELSITQWAFDIDLIYNLKKRGFRIKEQPTIWRDTEYSKLDLKKASIQVFFATFQLRLYNSPLKKFMPLLKKIIGPLWRNIT